MSIKVILKARKVSMTGDQYIELHAEETTIYKRGFFFEAGKILVQLAKRNQVPTLIALAEIDNIDTYDTLYGVGTSEKILELVTKLIASKCRTSDVIASMGEGKIGIIFYNITKVNAQKTLEGLSEAIANHIFLINQEEKHVTVHIGGTIMQNRLNSGTIDSLYEQATLALEAVKKRADGSVIVY